jgi:mono/diheme cytochrome c family protein
MADFSQALIQGEFMKKQPQTLMDKAQTAMQSIANRCLLTITLALSAPLAMAGNDASSNISVAPLSAYTQECTACHMAFPPAFLPAASWQRMMGNLGKHYGTDASLDASTSRAIATWLKDNAGTYKRVKEEPPQDRITQSAWFLRKHRDGEVPPNVWKRASVGSPANCAACHTGADKGNFDENQIRIPK